MICLLNKDEVSFPCSHNCPLFGDCVVEYEKQNKKPMTNFDRIKAMSVEEMAEYICGIQEAPCHCCHYQKETASCGGGFDTSICRAGVVKMLESEVAIKKHINFENGRGIPYKEEEEYGKNS